MGVVGGVRLRIRMNSGLVYGGKCRVGEDGSRSVRAGGAVMMNTVVRQGIYCMSAPGICNAWANSRSLINERDLVATLAALLSLDQYYPGPAQIENRRPFWDTSTSDIARHPADLTSHTSSLFPQVAIPQQPRQKSQLLRRGVVRLYIARR